VAHKAQTMFGNIPSLSGKLRREDGCAWEGTNA